MFTKKFKHVLNIHAPWIIFQQRKFICPWITEDTKKLMVQRDQLKQRAKELAVRDQVRAIRCLMNKKQSGLNTSS